MNKKSIKVYIAGRLDTERNRRKLEKIDSLCRKLGLITFLPHRDVGLFEEVRDLKKIFEGDIIEGFENCDIVVASLDGFYVGAGTAWELGYAYAKGIPAIGIKTDKEIKNSIEELSAILISSMKIVESSKELEEELIKRFG